MALWQEVDNGALLRHDLRIIDGIILIIFAFTQGRYVNIVDSILEPPGHVRSVLYQRLLNTLLIVLLNLLFDLDCQRLAHENVHKIVLVNTEGLDALDRLINKLRCFFINAGVIINYCQGGLALLLRFLRRNLTLHNHCLSIENFFKKSVADGTRSFHDENYFENFIELFLDEVFTLNKIPRLHLFNESNKECLHFFKVLVYVLIRIQIDII